MENHCIRWTADWVRELYQTANLLIFLAYMMIPYKLWNLRRQRPDLIVRWFFICFFLFIVSCGIGHELTNLTLEYDWYDYLAIQHFLTAILSWVTVVTFYRMKNNLYHAPKLSDYLEEIERRKEAEAELLRKNQELGAEIARIESLKTGDEGFPLSYEMSVIVDGLKAIHRPPRIDRTNVELNR